MVRGSFKTNAELFLQHKHHHRHLIHISIGLRMRSSMPFYATPSPPFYATSSRLVDQ
jgi:hypothetical protein